MTAVLLVLTANAASAKDRPRYTLADAEKYVPKPTKLPDNRTYVLIAFSYKGRYFTTGKQYYWMKFTSRSRAVQNWLLWKNSGFGVHTQAGTYKSDEEIEKEARSIYQKTYAAKYGGRTKSRPTTPAAGNVASIAGTKWSDTRDAESDYWFDKGGRVQVGLSKNLTSNRRGTWSQSGNQITIKFRGDKQVWTLRGNSMINGLRKLVKLK